MQAAALDLALARRQVFEHFGRELNWSAVGRRATRAYEDLVARKRLLLRTSTR